MVGFGGLVGEARLGRRGVLIGGRFLSSPPRRGVPPWRRRRRPEGRRPGAGAAGAPHDHAGAVIADARPRMGRVYGGRGRAGLGARWTGECEADKTVTLEPGAVRITRFSDSLEVTTMHVPEQTQAMCRCGSRPWKIGVGMPLNQIS